jgi:hypothetical protein
MWFLLVPPAVPLLNADDLHYKGLRSQSEASWQLCRRHLPESSRGWPAFGLIPTRTVRA